jgi:predicted MPP superfamily phosphohydrolase
VELLLVAGDFYDGVAGNDAQLAQALAQIQTPHGTYFAPGNHEEYNDLHHYLDHLTQA